MAPASQKGTRSSPVPEKKVPPYMTCPFSGELLRFQEVGPDRNVMVVSPHGWTSKIFPTQEQAREWASFRGGRQTFEAPRLIARELEPPVRDAEEAVAGLSPDPDSVPDDALPKSLR